VVVAKWGNKRGVGHSYIVYSIWYNNFRVNMLISNLLNFE
jgi:hypothetical protein